jgi:hypothetical protein
MDGLNMTVAVNTPTNIFLAAKMLLFFINDSCGVNLNNQMLDKLLSKS